ncbi:MAG TPA: F0F1 ATP synthase subunit beta, partial [Pseudomonadota bacterium]|nr:F0F1 ATP synthase subunit beta [Pseudomonadota bacterium]
MTNDGVIVRVRGSVVDVRFQSGELPAIGEALTVKLGGRTLMLEVQQHSDVGQVRCVSLDYTEGL